ncbi:unnamed protein product [Caretta caretta]
MVLALDVLNGIKHLILGLVKYLVSTECSIPIDVVVQRERMVHKEIIPDEKGDIILYKDKKMIPHFHSKV